MKRIIFDIDNTLLMYNPDYLKYYDDALKELGYEHSIDIAKDIFKSIRQYEKDGYIFERYKLINYINDKLNTNYDIKLLDAFNNKIANYWVDPINSDLIDTLEYLSSKYELYILTNYFTDVQSKRLEIVGIKKYFKKFIGGDMVKVKPHIDAFKAVIEDLDPNECMMIGDHIIYDYEGAKKVGMKALLYDFKHQYRKEDVDKIDDIKELMEIL